MKPKLVSTILNTGLTLKFANGVAELLLAVIFYFSNSTNINKIIKNILAPELLEDPKDLLLNFILRFFVNLSLSTKTIIIIYLILHGLIKIFIVLSLWKKKLRAYPTSIFLISSLIMIEILSVIYYKSVYQLIFIIVDIMILTFLSIEYRDVLKKRLH